MKEQLNESVSYIKSKLNAAPEIGLILGSGLGVLADSIEEPVVIDYKDIPHFPESTVSGHKGRLVCGMFEGRQVLAMQGRFHYYEGYTMQEVTFPVRVMNQLGVDKLLVTNAAGGVNTAFTPGDLMILTDHINNMGNNPLIGPNDDDAGVRFPDMSRVYTESYIDHASKCADDLGMDIQKGVYVANTGPVYETPAEVRMLRMMGGDAVGMSTVPEVIAAAHTGMKVLGISCISNMAAGILDQPLTHDEVIETTEKVKGNFIKLVKKIIQTLPQ
ncbi:Purine-nucleoside phosphorylase [Lentibacillus sp. JNUCC-1]|uniref:purine-nucleoside phosphorylase n=1 Tax=Lentibacillus sp. JNUCC-1 TaxID=2654513 RepID=UPI0012E8AEF5|nr:purine-nucleoside phosphorylase [Lentibacillus sp. JNUCC-1]MUV39722.1 Purine-nucleoside phosphorylase [Lentibacillus sp. JNUCC-1]